MCHLRVAGVAWSFARRVADVVVVRRPVLFDGLSNVGPLYTCFLRLYPFCQYPPNRLILYLNVSSQPSDLGTWVHGVVAHPCRVTCVALESIGVTSLIE